ncbi:S8 family serine peptidase [Geminicoccaceae bacterium 1502E]|nr:S8 family serine peptidase [Geminicoccaceae bacterium 1502E]
MPDNVLERWIVSARSGATPAMSGPELQALLQAAGVRVLQVTGPAARPRAVIEASAEQAARLGAANAGTLNVSRDQSLNLFANDGGGKPRRGRNTRREPAGDRDDGRSEMAPQSTDADNGVVPLATGSKRTYMLAPRRSIAARAAGLQPMSLQLFNASVQSLGIEVVKRIRRGRGAIQTLSAGAGEASDVVVARIEPDRAELIRSSLPPQFVLSEDKPLDYGRSPTLLRAAPGVAPMSLGANANSRNVSFKIVGDDDAPLAGVTVQLTGDAFPSSGQTNNKGEISLPLVTLGNRPARALFVTPQPGYWDLYINNPQLAESAVNLIRMRSLADTVAGFPRQFGYGWGQRLMGLDGLPGELGGKGVRIAIIDSGCDNTHPLLTHVTLGRDFTGAAAGSWTEDVVGHGTHCAGVITARPAEGLPWRGFAPEAEVHALRIFPGGAYSSLLEALDYCIDQQIDIVNMSLGGDSEVNPTVEETLEAAALNGIICIVAAGNSGDAVKYPASSSQALAVAAIGNVADLQPDTWDATTMQSGLVSADGIFSPSFTCHGPQVDVCAPGVGIVSTVPGNMFEPQSGTSMAAPHITGMAALLLAHHPVFQSQLRGRSPQRVHALAQMLRSVAAPYAFGADRTGSGMPRLQPLVTQLAPGAQQPAEAQPQTATPQPPPQTLGFATGGVAPMAAGPAAGPAAGGGHGALNGLFATGQPQVWIDPRTGALFVPGGYWRPRQPGF